MHCAVFRLEENSTNSTNFTNFRKHGAHCEHWRAVAWNSPTGRRPASSLRPPRCGSLGCRKQSVRNADTETQLPLPCHWRGGGGQAGIRCRQRRRRAKFPSTARHNAHTPAAVMPLPVTKGAFGCRPGDLHAPRGPTYTWMPKNLLKKIAV